MSKKRFGGTKKKSGKAKSARRGRKSVSSKRRAAGKKAWRTRVRKHGSKAAAIAASFGKGRKGARKHKRGRRGAHYTSNRARRLARNPARVLAAIQKREGTTGLPPTAAEVRLARIITSRSTRVPKRGPTGEEAARLRFKEKLAREKRAEAARRVNHDRRVREEMRRRAEHDAAQRDAEAAINAEYASL